MLIEILFAFLHALAKAPVFFRCTEEIGIHYKLNLSHWITVLIISGVKDSKSNPGLVYCFQICPLALRKIFGMLCLSI